MNATNTTPLNPDTNRPVADAKDFKNLVDLMAIMAEGTARMGELENGLQQDWLDLVDARRKDYAALQFALGNAEESIETLALSNPQWFEKVKTLKTPYGTVAFRRTSKLEVKNEEVSLLLLEQMGEEGLPFIRTAKALNLEILEKLDDSELKRLRIKRVSSESCTIKPTKVDLGKAVKAAVKAESK
jgi:Bacteriophage Mu Gam like protein